MCQLTRFVFDDWVPKKLEIELQVPTDKPIDFEKYRGNGALKPGEEELPNTDDKEDSGEPDLDKNLLNILI